MSDLALSVQLADGTWLTPAEVSGISFTKTAPGGCSQGSATIHNSSWINRLGPGSTVIISDKGTAKPLWSGFVQADGLKRDGANQDLDLDLSGSAEMLTFATGSPLYSATGLPSMIVQQGGRVDGKVSVTNDLPGIATTSDPALLIEFPTGTINQNDTIPVLLGTKTTNQLIGLTGNLVGGISYTSDGSSNLWFAEIKGSGGSMVQVAGNTINRTPQAISTPAASNMPTWWLQFTLTFTAPSPVQNTGNYWTALEDIRIYGVALRRDGTPWTQTGTGFDPTVVGGWKANQIVEDLMATLLAPWIDLDPNKSVVDTSASLLLTDLDFSQLSGNGSQGGLATALDILNTLMSLIPTHFYSVGVIDPSTMDTPLSWKRWPTSPRWIAPVDDLHFESSNTSESLCNVVTVVAAAPSNGFPTQATATGTVQQFPDLGTLPQGLTRTKVVDLSSQTLTQSQAQQIANAVLPTVAAIPRAGTLTISEPILDLTTGVMTPPAFIEPGFLMHVPSTGDDLRITEVAYDADSGTATVKLSTTTLGIDQLLAGFGIQNR